MKYLVFPTCLISLISPRETLTLYYTRHFGLRPVGCPPLRNHVSRGGALPQVPEHIPACFLVVLVQNSVLGPIKAQHSQTQALPPPSKHK